MYVDQNKITTGFVFSTKKRYLYYQPSMVCNNNDKPLKSP